MVIDFAREGEQVTDAAFRARLILYYRLMRAGWPQRAAAIEAVAAIDRNGQPDPHRQQEAP